jgi:phosphoribosylformylglycinamidine (FGAM) synthase PurS component
MPVHTVTLTVALRITDNEARSALEAVRVKMGVGQVVGLAREDVWSLDVDAPSAEEARAAVARLVEGTNLFANPNKHRHSLDEQPLAADEVAVLVSDRESGQAASMLEAVRRSGDRSVVAARRRARWRIRLGSPPSPGQPGLLDLIRSIAVAEGRTEGLLANPHSQTVTAVLPWGDENPLVA